jgi:hypothetical protein
MIRVNLVNLCEPFHTYAGKKVYPFFLYALGLRGSPRFTKVHTTLPGVPV